jgi:glycosyltransferase involved in cell wall biosynthesis
MAVTEWAEIESRVLHLQEIDSPLTPYMSSGEYSKQVSEFLESKRQTSAFARESMQGPKDSLVALSGDYGGDLINEVRRYGVVAGHLVKNRPVDIIHAHDWMTFPAGIAAKEASGLPLVVHVHALEFDRNGENASQHIYDIEHQGMSVADRILAVSQRTKNMITSRYGINPEKIDVVHNGTMPLNGSPIRAPRVLDEKLVVFLGRITTQKGPEYFIEAAALVAKHLPNVRFAMAGNGDMLPKMIEQMARLNLIDKFHFTGFLGESKRNYLLSLADAFVMTSVSEPFGLTPVEAIQHDVPVIITKQSGVAEVLRGALKVDFWDVRKTADAIIHVLTADGLAEAIVAGARADLESITWENAARKIYKVYQEIV